MILGQPLAQGEYSTPAHLLGWAYHFSNGATFGVMYLALIGNAEHRPWCWAFIMAAGSRVGKLLKPYPGVFSLDVSGRFIFVTAPAHTIFGAVLGLTTRRLAIACRMYG
jgi:hypothetical protein